MATFLISMWISNTATTAMMIPVALGLCRTIRAAAPELDRPRFDRHAEGMLLGLTYAASLGGIATPVGTAPNVIALGMIDTFRDAYYYVLEAYTTLGEGTTFRVVLPVIESVPVSRVA